jgi:crotonobetainyl-CoA:carnitine CoA-transferase CaiB-like acyl-CoA transferase
MRSLDGIRVIDLSRLLPGPMCTWYLAGMGATVVKVEEPGKGDYLRFSPPYCSDGQGAWFSSVNSGKRSVALDLKRPVHVEALHALLEEADVLVESFRPGVMARLGLAPELLTERYPRLVICSITGFGQDGPFADLPGHDLGYMAVTGGLSLGTRRDGVPDLPGLQVADTAGGALMAAFRICAALLERERTGRGSWLDVAMTDGVLSLVAPAFAGMAASGELPAPGGEPLSGGAPNYGLYRCKDGGVIALAALEPKFWMSLCASIGQDVPMDPEEIAALIATRDRDEWADLLGPACVNAMLEISEVAEHPHHQARGMFVGEGMDLRVRPPFPGGAECASQPAPQLGAHTVEELAHVGFDADRLEEST